MSLLLKNLVAADETGDWGRHLMTIEKLIPIFEQLDSISYLGDISFYLEMISKLAKPFPEIYEKFMKGNFVVKTKPGIFHGIAPDMKLEQTIQ